MSYTAHNFKAKSVLSSADLNEMDAQIAENAAESIKITSQTLTDAQKTQARANIAAAGTGDIDALNDNLDARLGEPGYSVTDLSGFTPANGFIMQDQVWGNITASYQHIYIPVGRAGASLTITDNGNYVGYLAVVKSYSAPVAGVSPNFSDADGYTERITIPKNATRTYHLPSDAGGIILNVIYGGNDNYPTSFALSVPASDGDVTARITTLETEVGGMMDEVEQNVFEGFPHTLTWESGTYSTTKGAAPSKSAESRRQRTASVLSFPGGATIKTNEAYAIKAALCDADGNVQTTIGYTNSDISIPPDTQFVLILERGDGSADISDMTSAQINALVTATSDRIANLIKTNVNWCAMGDSITQGYISYIRDEDQGDDDPEDDPTATSHVDTANSWATKVANRNNWSLTNLGVGGTGYLDPKNKPPSMSQEDYTEAYKRRGYYVARNTDFTPYNLVTLAYGINDWKANLEMGSIDDPIEDGSGNFITPTKVIPAMRATIEAILHSMRAEGETGAPNPACKIIVILPLNCLGYKNASGERAYANDDGFALGHEYSNSGTLETFVGKMIEVCNYYGIQYIDMTHYSCVNRVNIADMLLDGVHPCLECHDLLAHELGRKITF